MPYVCQPHDGEERPLLQLCAPKCATTFTTQVLIHQRGARRLRGGHDAWSSLSPAEREGHTLLGTVRNPWAWYASWWMHARRGSTLFDALAAWGGGSVDFRDVLYGLTHPEAGTAPNGAPFAFAVFYWQAITSAAQGRHRAAFMAAGEGLYSYTLRHTYGDALDVTLDATQIGPALSQFLGVDVSGHRPANTRFQRPIGYTPPDDPLELYDDEMIGWVAEADADLISRYGYAPGTPAAQAVWQ